MIHSTPSLLLTCKLLMTMVTNQKDADLALTSVPGEVSHSSEVSVIA